MSLLSNQKGICVVRDLFSFISSTARAKSSGVSRRSAVGKGCNPCLSSVTGPVERSSYRSKASIPWS
ncbi:hypothetical protein SynBIOSE41_01298 [Synechococcus sp. BIOS-E4-1]|nr:hypothetical protein SynBIOSE41_01298 [Synechococcus sp. BIOS-E4-1]